MTTTTRRKRTPSPEELAAGGTPHVAATAGTAPAGAIGGDQVLSAARNRAETGQTQATAVPENYGEVTGTGIETTGDTGAAPVTVLTGGEGTGGGGTAYSDDATGLDEGGNTGEIDPYQDLDQMFEDYARGVFDEVDTSADEAMMKAEQDRLLGRSLVDTRARMGEAGFAAGGLDVALENTARREAAEQLGLNISDLRDREGEQRRGAIEGAMRIDNEKQSSARQDAILKAQMDALNELTEGAEAPTDRNNDGVPDAPSDFGEIKDGATDTDSDGNKFTIHNSGESPPDDAVMMGTDANGNEMWAVPGGGDVWVVMAPQNQED